MAEAAFKAEHVLDGEILTQPKWPGMDWPSGAVLVSL